MLPDDTSFIADETGLRALRSALWDGTRHIDRAILPSYAEMLLDHVGGLTRDENERQTQAMAGRRLY
jgi:hypothetical protein